MPFPLSSLPYGFRKRIRELATPIEAYQLQIAAPKFSGFQPLVTLNRSSHMYQVDGLISDSHFIHRMGPEERLIPMSDNELHHARQLWLKNIINVDKALSILNYCFLSPCQNLIFSQMHINLALVKKIELNLNVKINNNNNDEQKLGFHWCTYDPEALPFVYRTLFKHFQHIAWHCFPQEVTWLQDMVNENVSGLHSLYVEFGSPDMFNVDKALFVKFFMAQATDFVFFIQTPRPSDPLFEQNFNNLMNENFTELDDFRHVRSSRTAVLKQLNGFNNGTYSWFKMLPDV